MNPDSARNPLQDAEETLRLLATQPPPPGLNDRVHRRLQVAEREVQSRSFWSLWRPIQRFQFVGAAALTLAVAASAWSVYHGRIGAHSVFPQAQTPIRIQQPLHSPGPANNQPQGQGTGGFSAAKGEGRPNTLNPIKVPPPPRKKPSASHQTHRLIPTPSVPADSK